MAGGAAGCRTLDSARKLVAGAENASAVSIDVTNDAALDSLVARHDLVISLVPYSLHVAVIRSAIRARKHVVTTSYISQAMAGLDQQCRDAGITVMNEIGLDPYVSRYPSLRSNRKGLFCAMPPLRIKTVILSEA